MRNLTQIPIVEKNPAPAAEAEKEGETTAEEWKLGPMLKEYRFQEYFSFDITPYASLAVFEPGELILREGQRVTKLYYLVKGRAKLFATLKNGKVSLFNFYEVPSFLGEMEMLDPEAHTKGVRAHTRCYCIALDLTRCGDRVLNDPRFLRAICLYLGRKAVSNSWHYAQSQSYPLKYRLASYILFTSRDGVYAEPHTEAAEYLGISYRHLLYVLADFCREGILERGPKGYLLRDPQRLQALQDELQE